MEKSTKAKREDDSIDSYLLNKSTNVSTQNLSLEQTRDSTIKFTLKSLEINSNNLNNSNKKQQIIEDIDDNDINKKIEEKPIFQKQSEIYNRPKKSSLSKQLSSKKLDKTNNKYNKIDIKVLKEELQQQQQEQNQQQNNTLKQQSSQKQSIELQNKVNISLLSDENDTYKCKSLVTENPTKQQNNINNNNKIFLSTPNPQQQQNNNINNQKRGSNVSQVSNYSLYNSNNSTISVNQKNKNNNFNTNNTVNSKRKFQEQSIKNNNQQQQKKKCGKEWMPTGRCTKLDTQCKRFIYIKDWESQRQKSFSFYKNIYIQLQQNLIQLVQQSDGGLICFVNYIEEHIDRNNQMIQQMKGHAFSKRHKVTGTIVGSAYSMLESLNNKKGIQLEKQNKVLIKILDQLSKNLELYKTKINTQKFINNQQSIINGNFKKMERIIHQKYYNYENVISKKGKATAKNKDLNKLDTCSLELHYFHSVHQYYQKLKLFGQEIIDFYFNIKDLEFKRMSLVKDILEQYIQQQQQIFNNMEMVQLLDQVKKIQINFTTENSFNIEHLLLPEYITYIKQKLQYDKNYSLEIQDLQSYQDNFQLQNAEENILIQDTIPLLFKQKKNTHFEDMTLLITKDENLIFQKGHFSIYQLPYIILPMKHTISQKIPSSSNMLTITKIKDLICFRHKKKFTFKFGQQQQDQCTQKQIIDKINQYCIYSQQ